MSVRRWFPFLVSLLLFLTMGLQPAPAIAAPSLEHGPSEISGGGAAASLPVAAPAAFRTVAPESPSWHGLERRGSVTSPGAPGLAPLAPQVIFPGAGFDGFDFDDNVTETGGFVFIPPDPIGAAGPDRLVAVVNVMIEARDKSGTLLWRDSLQDFFAPAVGNLGTFTFDPKIIYDDHEDRFVVVTLERTDAGMTGPTDESRILLAVSKTSTPASATAADWEYHVIDSKTNIGGTDHWADYPGFEVDEEAVYVTANMFPFGGGASGGVRLWIVDKGVAAGFYAGGAAAVTVHDPYAAAGLVVTTMPAQIHDGSVPGAGIGTFLVGYNSLTTGGPGGLEAVQVVRVNDPLGAVTFTQEFVFVGDLEDVGGAFGFPPIPDAPQSGSATGIEVNDSRAYDAVWRDDGLWLTTTINPNAGPDAGTATAHWFRLDTSAVVDASSASGLITVGDQGNIGGEDIAANTSTFFPSVAVNSAKEAKFGFAASAATIFGGAYVTGRQPADPLGTVQGSETVKAGIDTYVRVDGLGRNRWGDYSGIAVDPADDTQFWVFNEYAITRGTPTGGGDGRWGTAWRECSFEPQPSEAPPPFVRKWGGPGSGPGQFGFQNFNAVDDCGNVYVVDAGNDRIQKFDSFGNFLLEWGTTGSGPGQFQNPVGIAVGASRRVYVSDESTDRVEAFDEDGNFLFEWGTTGSGPGEFVGPRGLATNGAGHVFVVDGGNDRVQRFDGDGLFVLEWGSGGTGDGQFDLALGIATDPSGNVYVTDESLDRIQKFDGTGTLLTKWGSSGNLNGQFLVPFGIATDASNDVYVADFLNDRVQKFDANGGFLTVWGVLGAGDGEFNRPSGLAYDVRRDQVVVNDRNNTRVQKFGVADSPPLPFVLQWGTGGMGPGEFLNPAGVTVDPNGVVFALDRGNNRVQKFNAMGDFLGEWGSPGSGPGQFNNPNGIEADDLGNVFVADDGNDRIQKFDSDGTFLTEWGGSGSGPGQFSSPVDVTTNPGGDVYVVDGDNHRVQKFDNNGTFLTEWGGFGSGNGQLFAPTGVAVDPAGNVVVVDRGNDRIQRFDGSGVFLDTWGVTGAGPGQFDTPVTADVDAAGTIYVADFDNFRIQFFDNAGSYLGQWGCLDGAPSQFNRPRGIALDDDGDLYVIEDANNRIQRFGAGTVDVPVADLPAGRLALAAPVPNPMRGSTVIRFVLPEKTTVRLGIHDVRGRRVTEAYDGRTLPAGEHRWSWDGRNADGLRLAPGIYFVTLETPLGSRTRKSVILP